jgi:hypothetical protein
MWTNISTSKQLGLKSIATVRGCLSLLIQPKIRDFVFKGLEMSTSDFENGAEQAAQTVYHHMKAAESNVAPTSIVSSRALALEQSLEGLCSSELVQHLAAETIPDEGVVVDNVTFAHTRLVVGGGRMQAESWRASVDPVDVGDGLVILARSGDFGALPDWVQSLFGLRISDQYCRKLMLEHGLTVQCAVNVACRIGGDANETFEQQWLFESGTLDPAFKRPPQWQVVDINGIGALDKFWVTRPCTEVEK